MQNQFENLISKDKYQVFLMYCPASFPFIFAVHPWFVINKMGQVSRWAVSFQANKENQYGAHLYKNKLPAFQGLQIIYPYIFKLRWPAKLLGIVEGDENSLAKKMIDFIEASPSNYKYRNNYSFTGPNSNTYVQWVLNNFKECKIKLPWNSFGKNFKIL